MSGVTLKVQLDRILRSRVEQVNKLHNAITEHVGRSIRYGSPLTGAPGQPVREGNLLASWFRRDDGPYRSAWRSDLVYSSVIEHNRRGATLRSSVGGFHSVKITRRGMPAIIRHELKKHRGGKEDMRGRGSRVRSPGTGRWM